MCLDNLWRCMVVKKHVLGGGGGGGLNVRYACVDMLTFGHLSIQTHLPAAHVQVGIEVTVIYKKHNYSLLPHLFCYCGSYILTSFPIHACSKSYYHNYNNVQSQALHWCAPFSTNVVSAVPYTQHVTLM